MPAHETPGTDGAVLLHPEHERWPAAFADLGSIAPRRIFALGALDLLQSQARTALIGGRTATVAGRAAGVALAAGLAARGDVLVTPAETGTDLAVVDAARRAGGRIIAITDRPPMEAGYIARAAQRGILEHGGLLLWEASSPRGGTTSHRSARLIAALAPRLVLVEIGARSAGMTAAAIAGGLSRAVAATPTDQSRPGRGTRQLLAADLATLVQTPDELDALSDPRTLAHL